MYEMGDLATAHRKDTGCHTVYVLQSHELCKQHCVMTVLWLHVPIYLCSKVSSEKFEPAD